MIEQYLFLCIYVQSLNMVQRLEVYLLFKSFVLFCNINNLYCHIEFTKITLELFIEMKLNLKINTKILVNRSELNKLEIRYLVLDFINVRFLNFIK